MHALEHGLSICPLVAILRGVRPDEVIAIGEALVAAGMHIIEVPLNSPEPFDSIARLTTALGERALVGAGTVLSVAHAQEVARAGGRLVVMPHTDVEVIRAAKSAGLYALPGFATPSEAFAALKAGADALKLFPAEANPPAALKAMRAVLPKTVKILPVGSITPDNMAAYLAAGADGFGLGSALYKPGADAAQVSVAARAFIAALAAAR